MASHSDDLPNNDTKRADPLGNQPLVTLDYASPSQPPQLRLWGCIPAGVIGTMHFLFGCLYGAGVFDSGGKPERDLLFNMLMPFVTGLLYLGIDSILLIGVAAVNSVVYGCLAVWLARWFWGSCFRIAVFGRVDKLD